MNKQEARKEVARAAYIVLKNVITEPPSPPIGKRSPANYRLMQIVWGEFLDELYQKSV